MGVGHRRVVWSRGAYQELDEAIAFVASDSVARAGRMLERILDAAASLSTLGERGRVVPERVDSRIRELLIEPYRLLYHLDDDRVVILGLLHQRREFGEWARGRR